MSLKEYKAKRNFKKTKEPAGKSIKNKGAKMFVVQKHHASHLHYDFRLELDGVLKSWAVPKGPSLNPKEKRLAVEVEDHPIDYATFEGEIPKGEYGGGHVIVWDKGKWLPPENVEEQLKKGHLEFELQGQKLGGSWMLLRTRMPGAKKNNWLLIKRDDENASSVDITKNDKSVLSGVSLEELESEMVGKPKRITKQKKDKFLTFAQLGSPELATLVGSPPVGSEWIHEIKYDGYLTLCFKNKKSTKLLTRSGFDWSKKYSNLQKECNAINVDSIVIDGEIVCPDENGKSSFDGLQSACENKLEGIISKNSESHYTNGRNKNWLKVKCTNVQEFVIGGYYLQENNASLGSLLMGAYNQNGEFQYLGKVGTGFDTKTSKSLLTQLKKLKIKESKFDKKSPKFKNIIWVKPSLVGNIEFGAWTDKKMLRHAAFKGLRKDKKADEVILDEVKESSKSKVALTHPDKIIYPKDNITKQDLSNYYTSVQKWMIPHVKQRPLALLRCPNGEGKPCFFQKHIKVDQEGILRKKTGSKFKKKKEDVLYIDSNVGLQELVQLGTMEIHSRGCTVDEIDYPNQIVFDFDPDIDIKFSKVKEATFLLKAILDKQKLKSFIKVTGGKGVHVHVPIAPEYDWDQIKSFSKSVCEQMENEYPDKFTTSISKAKRKGKIFLDYLRNSYGASAIAPYSVRAKEHAPVALPITWSEAKKLKSVSSYILKKVPTLLKKRKDPWLGYEKK